MSFFGFLIETCWAYYRHAEIIIKSSMLLEFLIPLYGIGAILFILLFYKIKNSNSYIIFFISMIFGGLFEVVCSLFQEFFLGTSSWDYSSKFMPLFGGRICLKYCIFWGIIGLIWIKYLWPKLNAYLNKQDVNHLKYMALILIGIFTFDVAITIMACNRRVERFYEVEATSKIDLFLDNRFDDDYLREKFTNIKIVEK